MGKALRRASRRLRKAGAFAIGIPGALWRFLMRLRHDPMLRERTLAQTVFAGIFMFAAGSFDFILTGGPDWNPGATAIAAPMPVRHVAASRPTPVTEAPPAPVEPESITHEEATAPVEDLLGGPDTILAGWGLREDPVSGQVTEIAYSGPAAKPQLTVYSILAGVPDKQL